MTGASGFIGRHAARSLVSKNVDVVALFHDRAVDATARRAVQGDLVSGEGLSALLSDVGALIHCASYVGPNEAQQQRVNVEGTERLLAAAQHAGVERIVYLSTAGVYGGIGVGGTEESLLPAPRSSLSRTRHEAELLVLEAGGIVVRPNAVVGAGDRWYLSQILAVMLKHGVWIEEGRPKVSAIEARVLGDVLASLLLSPPPHRVYHAAAPQPVTIRELVGPVFARLGVPLPERSIDGEDLHSMALYLGISSSQLQMVAEDNLFDTSRLWSHLPDLARDVRLSPADVDWYAQAVSSAVQG